MASTEANKVAQSSVYWTHGNIVGGETLGGVAISVWGVTEDGSQGDHGATSSGHAAELDAVGANGATDAVSSGDDPVSVHDGATATEWGSDEPASLPRPFILIGRSATDDVSVRAASSHTSDQSEKSEHLHDYESEEVSDEVGWRRAI